VVKPQENQKQFQGVFCAELQTVFINIVNRGAEEEEHKQSTVESSSLCSSPASAVSTVSYCSSSFPSLSPSPSPSSSAFSTVRKRRTETVHNRAQWRAALSAHHQPLPFPSLATALPLPLPLHLLHSLLFTLHVNSGEQLTTSLLCFHRQPLLLLPHFLHSPLSEEEEQKHSIIEHSGEQIPQLTTGLHRFHRQPLLFLFSFSFVFYILHCSRCM